MEKTKLKNGLDIWHHDKGDFIGDTIDKNKDFFEARILRKIAKIIGTDNIETVCEIGANIGNHVVYWDWALKPSVIYAYEPVEDNFEILKKNTRSLSAKAIINNFGLGPKNEKVEIYINKENYGASSINFSKDLPHKTISIKSIDGQLYKENFDLIKIDIEGSEKTILHTVAQYLKSNGKYLMIELRGGDYIGEEEKILNFFSLMRKNGWVCVYAKKEDYIFSRSGKEVKAETNFYNRVRKHYRYEFDLASRSDFEDIISKYKEVPGKKSFSSLMVWSKLYRLFVRGQND